MAQAVRVIRLPGGYLAFVLARKNCLPAIGAGVDLEQSEQDTVQTARPEPATRPAPRQSAAAEPGATVFLTKNVSIYYGS